MLGLLKARYERRNPLALLSMGLIDCVCWLVNFCFLGIQHKLGAAAPVRSVLLVNPAHLGDVVISTAAIRLLKQINPEIKVGFVAGSWAKLALEGHPGVDQIYLVDHWKLNRSNASAFSRLRHYLRTWHSARLAIKKDGYDLGILLNSFSPNLAPLLWWARVPNRIGYVSAGASPLLTQILPKPDSIKSEQLIQLRLLECFDFYGDSSSWLEPCDANLDMLSQLAKEKHFVVLHPGTGNPAKAWPSERWVELAKYFSEQDFEVVLTGQGAQEFQLAQHIADLSGSHNFVGRLSWQEWLDILGKAKMVVGVDSAVGHVCAALHVPFVGIYAGIGSVARWAPRGEQVVILNKAMPCSPCNTKPCAERACITSITVDDVKDIAKMYLNGQVS